MSARQTCISSPMPITKAHCLSSVYWLEGKSFERRQIPVTPGNPWELSATTPQCLSVFNAWVTLLFCLGPRLLLALSTNTHKIQYPLHRTSSTKWKKDKRWKKSGCAGGIEQAVTNHSHFHSQPLKMKAKTWCFPLGLCGWDWAHEASPPLWYVQNHHLGAEPPPGCRTWSRFQLALSVCSCKICPFSLHGLTIVEKKLWRKDLKEEKEKAFWFNIRTPSKHRSPQSLWDGTYLTKKLLLK